MTAADLLLRLQPRLQARIRWMMGEQARSLGDSGDVMGELNTKILAGIAALHWRDEEHFLALATRIARNLIVDSVRSPRLRRFESLTASLTAADIEDQNGDPASVMAARGEQIATVCTALEALSEPHRRVIELRDLEGLSFREVGAVLDRSENAAQILHARALLALGRELRR